jgi:multicomponent K+:H+ antiporter subunit E
MTRARFYPMVSVLLFATWLALAASIAPLQVAAAAVLALAIPFALGRLLGPPVGFARPAAALRLALIVAWDVIVANTTVARLVLGPTARLRPAFVTVPLDTRHPDAAALLASIITMTPGTVSSELDDARTRILVHVLDLEDGPRLVARIKARYERPLMEIFGC